MTDDLIKRLRAPMWKQAPTDIQRVAGQAADALEAERLKRQQAEHERDCILEDLAGVQSRLEAAERAAEGLHSLLREVRDAYMQDTRPFKLFGKAWNLRGAVDAAIAQGQWKPCGHDDPSWCTDKCVPPWKRAQEQKRD